MADELEMGIEALKKAYADIILKASQEAAARVMVAERKAFCFEHDLVSLKEESLRMFLRLKENSNQKIAEAEGRSLNQQMKIEELEAQLSEAEGIIVDLREELKQVQDQLEIKRHNSNKPLKGHILAVHELANERVPLDNNFNSYPVVESLVSDAKLVTLDHNLHGMVLNKCCHAIADTILATKLNLNHFHGANEETDLYINGCTERVCAFDRNPYIKLSTSRADQTLVNCQSEISLEKADNSSQCPVLENKHISSNRILCEEILDNVDQSLVNFQSQNSLEKADDCSQYPVTENKYITSNPILCEKNVKTLQSGLGRHVLHECSSNKIQETRSLRRSPGKNARYREAIAALRRSCHKKPHRSWRQLLPYQHKVLCNGETVQSVEVPIKAIDNMPKTEVCGASKSDDNRSSSGLKLRHNLLCDEQVDGTVLRETFLPVHAQLVDSKLVDVPIFDRSGNPHCSDDNDRVLKFTFHRKRRQNVLTKVDENIVPDNSTMKRKSEKPTNTSSVIFGLKK